MKKRDFLKLTFGLGLGLLFRTRTQADKAKNLSWLPILQGHTTENAALFSILGPKNLDVDFIVTKFGKRTGTVHVTKATRDFSGWVAYKVRVSGLSLSQEYKIEILASDGSLIDQRQFSTVDRSKTSLKMALASCMRDIMVDEQKPMWDRVRESNPDALFLLGDNVYVDQGKPDEITEELIWRRYIETRLTLDLYRWQRLVPTYATWDDHDFGLNNSHRDFALSAKSGAIFRDMYAQDSFDSTSAWGPGVSTRVHLYGQNFYLMDDRTFRTGPSEREESHWGTDQENWLYSDLSKRNNPSWIFNGSQFFGGYRTGWAYERRHPRSFKDMCRRVADTPGVIAFGSGDVHYSEVMQIESQVLGYQTYEITSSSMHSANNDPRRGNSRRIASTSEFNFVLVESSVDENLGLNISARSIGVSPDPYFLLNNLKSIRKSKRL